MRRRILVPMLLACVLPLGAHAIELRPDGSWVPAVEFDFDGASFSETMHWVSGWSYALTEVARAQTRSGGERLFCPPSRGYVESRVLLTILNEKFKGQRITAEQAANALWNAVKEHYPCPGRSRG
jgi:hypothetical protein